MFDSYLSQVLASGRSVLEAGLILLCLALWVYRKSPRRVIQASMPVSLRFNLAVASLDALLIAVPLTIFVAYIAGGLRSNGWTIIGQHKIDSIHFALVAVLAIFIGDFIAYWRHRLEHFGWFWKSHVMHHSDTQMTWFTVYRFHPINRLTTVLIDMGSLALIGFPAWAIVANAVFRHYYGIFVHINQPWTLGPLGSVLVSPAMHRWHHVKEGEGVGKNFASVFTVFDRAFGTHYCPGPCNEPLGVEGMEDGQLARQYLLPITDIGPAQKVAQTV